MVLASDFVQRVTERRQEVIVRGQDLPIHSEFDDGLRLADRRELAFKIDGGQLLLRDVGGILYHLERFTALVEDRIIAGLQPNLAAALADPLVLARVIFPTAKLVPEQPIVRAGPENGIDEHAVVLTANFLQSITESGKKIFVRG